MVVRNMYIILMYDITMDNNGSKVQRNIFKICKKYLFHVQLSVFEGEISKVQLETLKKELKKYIRPELDSVMVFMSRDKKWLDKEFLGKIETTTDNFL